MHINIAALIVTLFYLIFAAVIIFKKESKNPNRDFWLAIVGALVYSILLTFILK